MGFSWHSYHRNPEPRHRDRRSSTSTARMREALDAPLSGVPALSADAMARARERRARYAKRNEVPVWASTPPGSWLVMLGAACLGLILVAMAGMALVSLLSALPQ